MALTREFVGKVDSVQNQQTSRDKRDEIVTFSCKSINNSATPLLENLSHHSVDKCKIRIIAVSE
jgi:hypothetical protein